MAVGPMVVALILGAVGCTSAEPDRSSATSRSSTRSAELLTSRIAIRSFHPRWSADLDQPVDAAAGTIPRASGDGEWALDGDVAGDGLAVTGVLADPRSARARVASADRFTLDGQASISLVMLRGTVRGCGRGTAVLWLYGDPAGRSRWGVVPGFGTGELAGLAVDEASVSLTEAGADLQGVIRCDDPRSYLRVVPHPLFAVDPGPITERVQHEGCYLSAECTAGASGMFVVPWGTFADDVTQQPIPQDHPRGVVGRAVGFWAADHQVGVYVSMAGPGNVVDDGLIGLTLVWSTAPLAQCGNGSHVLLERTRYARLGDVVDSVDEVVPGLGTGDQASLTGDGVENGAQHAPPEGGHWWSDLVLRCS